MFKMSCHDFLLESDIKSFVGYYRDTSPMPLSHPSSTCRKVTLYRGWNGGMGHLD